ATPCATTASSTATWWRCSAPATRATGRWWWRASTARSPSSAWSARAPGCGCCRATRTTPPSRCLRAPTSPSRASTAGWSGPSDRARHGGGMTFDDDHGDLPPGVAPDTPGARPPRLARMQRQLQMRLRFEAANDPGPDAAALPPYAELHCLSDFSFLRGAASAEELFTRAARCGYEALAITDECSLAGIVRAHEAARITGVKLVVGAEFRLDDGLRLVLLVEDAAGYARLCRLITTARRAAPKGRYRLGRGDVEAVLAAPVDDAGGAAGGAAGCGLFALWLPGRVPDAGEGAWLRDVFGARARLAVELHREDDD